MGGCCCCCSRSAPEGACLQDESRDTRRCSSRRARSAGELLVGQRLPSLLFRRHFSLSSLSGFSSNPAFPLQAQWGVRMGEL